MEPAYGWGHLLITRDAMMSVLLSLDVSPIIYRYLKAFGRKDCPRDEGFAGFDSDITLDSSGTLVSFGKSRPDTAQESVCQALI